MKISLLISLLFISYLLPAQNISKETTTIILFRHAEAPTTSSDPRNPDLSEAGMERAKRLTSLLSDLIIDECYSTPLKRTQQTIQFIAAQRGQVTKEYDPRALPAFADALRQSAGKTILVAGHSNTTPTLVNLLIGEERYRQLHESEFGKIWMLTFINGKLAQTVVLNY
ncbi:MAG: phosphoglycerate mutase family protein [Saprospiraceae bacterium]|nr:phosphoglycerate mutase family protein [Saprospiraceae bacterium]